jgi:hypothetical protein
VNVNVLAALLGVIHSLTERPAVKPVNVIVLFALALGFQNITLGPVKSKVRVLACVVVVEVKLLFDEEEEALIVTVPVEPLIVMLVPATMLVTTLVKLLAINELTVAVVAYGAVEAYTA